MNKVVAYTSGQYGTIDQLPLHRDWMDLTFDRHAYQCFPVSLSNRLGWGISYPEDISFIWNGVNDSRADHVKILSGSKYVHPNRGNRTVSFYTDLTFVKEGLENLTLLTMPVPNQFIRGAQCMTTLISTSVLASELPIAWMITEPDIEITIPAGTPIAAIVPISLTEIQSYELEVKLGRPSYEDNKWNQRMRDRGDASQKKNMAGEWTHFYRDAIDHTGEAIGAHEAKKIVMKVTNSAKN
jgi:hypothetical protein